MNRTTIRNAVVIALFSALLTSSSFVKIPIPPVPITLQTFFVFIIALLFPLKLSLSCVCVYLFLGVAGLPVFTTGGGIAAFTGPTGGYLLGLIPSTLILGLGGRKKNFFPNFVLCCFATAALYIPGLLWLKHYLNVSWKSTFLAGFVPFIPTDILKIIVSVFTANKLREKTEIFFETDQNNT